MTLTSYDSLQVRFFDRLERSGECWLWTGYVNSFGYGTINVAKVQWKTHRLAWFLANGPIPDGLLVLHRCDTPACCRVDHLFLGTSLDNNRDRDAKRRNAEMQKTHCPKGHPYDEANTRFSANGRQRHCKTCDKEHVKKQTDAGMWHGYRARRRALTNKEHDDVP